MNEEDAELWNRLVEMANKVSDGHLTVMKFKTNWRVGFFTPNERKDLDLMPVGKTLPTQRAWHWGTPPSDHQRLAQKNCGRHRGRVRRNRPSAAIVARAKRPRRLLPRRAQGPWR
jgi:hypothetical protein